MNLISNPIQCIDTLIKPFIEHTMNILFDPEQMLQYMAAFLPPRDAFNLCLTNKIYTVATQENGLYKECFGYSCAGASVMNTSLRAGLSALLTEKFGRDDVLLLFDALVDSLQKSQPPGQCLVYMFGSPIVEAALGVKTQKVSALKIVCTSRVANDVIVWINSLGQIRTSVIVEAMTPSPIYAVYRSIAEPNDGDEFQIHGNNNGNNTYVYFRNNVGSFSIDPDDLCRPFSEPQVIKCDNNFTSAIDTSHLQCVDLVVVNDGYRLDETLERCVAMTVDLSRYDGTHFIIPTPYKTFNMITAVNTNVWPHDFLDEYMNQLSIEIKKPFSTHLNNLPHSYYPLPKCNWPNHTAEKPGEAGLIFDKSLDNTHDYHMLRIIRKIRIDIIWSAATSGDMNPEDYFMHPLHGMIDSMDVGELYNHIPAFLTYHNDMITCMKSKSKKCEEYGFRIENSHPLLKESSVARIIPDELFYDRRVPFKHDSYHSHIQLPYLNELTTGELINAHH